MDEQKAREIWDQENDYTSWEREGAECYLERVAQEKEIFGPLVDALKYFSDKDILRAQDRAVVDNALAEFYRSNPSWRK